MTVSRRQELTRFFQQYLTQWTMSYISGTGTYFTKISK